MKKFEYRVFNMSEVSEVDDKGIYRPRYKDGKVVTLADVLNEYGKEGWEVLFSITQSKQSYLMKREKT